MLRFSEICLILLNHYLTFCLACANIVLGFDGSHNSLYISIMLVFDGALDTFAFAIVIFVWYITAHNTSVLWIWFFISTFSEVKIWVFCQLSKRHVKFVVLKKLVVVFERVNCNAGVIFPLSIVFVPLILEFVILSEPILSILSLTDYIHDIKIVAW